MYSLSIYIYIHLFKYCLCPRKEMLPSSAITVAIKIQEILNKSIRASEVEAKKRYPHSHCPQAMFVLGCNLCLCKPEYLTMG